MFFKRANIWKFALSAVPFAVFMVFFFLFIQRGEGKPGDDIISIVKDTVQVQNSPTPTPNPLPLFYEIPLQTHVFQSFNNCGPATLSMALSYVGISIDQSKLGQILRPYQIPGGDNDDKSVTLAEVADHAETYGLTSYLRPNGTIEKLEQFIANDIPVVTRTWLKPTEDIGHYRVIRGYDKNSKELIQDDSLQGKNLRYSFDEFNTLWQPFNYEYLVIVPESKKEIAERILGDELSDTTAWANAKIRIKNELSKNPQNWHLKFALSRIHYYLGNYSESMSYFNAVENQLSFRTLWYQMEPLLVMYELKDYNRILDTSERILNNQNRAYSELYILRGKIFQERGQIDLARTEYEKAVFYNNGFASKIPQL